MNTFKFRKLIPGLLLASFLCAQESYSALRKLAEEVGTPVTHYLRHVSSVRWMSSGVELARDLESLETSYNPTGKTDKIPPKISVDLHPAWDLAVSHKGFAQALGLVQSVELDPDLGLKGTVKKSPNVA